MSNFEASKCANVSWAEALVVELILVWAAKFPVTSGLGIVGCRFWTWLM